MVAAAAVLACGIGVAGAAEESVYGEGEHPAVVAAAPSVPVTSTVRVMAQPVPPVLSADATQLAPVAGLSRVQMDNARVIVEVGRAMGLSDRAQVIAVACAMQESSLRNLANDTVDESFRYPHEGRGADHDSVGLFQQRPSAGWGSVRDLMRPEYAARRFYRKLVKVRDWQRMELTAAAQAVQGSAFPGAYAKHEARARRVVDALR
jgi:hypothetical protein